MQLTVTPADQEAFNCIAQIQGCIGPDSPDLLRFISYMRPCLTPGGWYDKATNATVKAYIDSICKALIPVTTDYGTNVPGLFIAYSWGQLVAGMDSYSVPQYFLGAVGGFSGPPEWTAAVSSPPGLSAAAYIGPLNSGPVIELSNYIEDDDGIDGDWIAQHENALFDPGRWTKYKDAAKALAPVWATQANDLNSLLSNTPKLDGEGALFLLHLLIALCNSPSPDDRDLVNAIAILTGNAGTDPTDPQPNAQLIDRLVYFAMLTWTDPLGSFTWTRDQVAARIAELGPALRNPDPGSTAISKVLQRETKILQAFPSYPSVDPEAPSLGFTQRRTRTLDKINDAWASYKRSR
jgi:hypothetical protein